MTRIDRIMGVRNCTSVKNSYSPSNAAEVVVKAQGGAVVLHITDGMGCTVVSMTPDQARHISGVMCSIAREIEDQVAEDAERGEHHDD